MRLARDVLAFLRLTRGARLATVALYAGLCAWGFSIGLQMMQ